MTVIRGDAARALMARTRPARRQHSRSYGPTGWSHRFDIEEAGRLGATVGCAAALLREHLAGTSSEQRGDDVVAVMSELVHDAIAASGRATLWLSWTPSGGVFIEVSDSALAGDLVPAAVGSGPRRDEPSARVAAAAERLSASCGLRPLSAGTCVWVRVTALRAC